MLFRHNAALHRIGFRVRATRCRLHGGLLGSRDAGKSCGCSEKVELVRTEGISPSEHFTSLALHALVGQARADTAQFLDLLCDRVTTG